MLATTCALSGIKKERNIHKATEAKADVEILLKKMEKRIEIPNQKEM